MYEYIIGKVTDIFPAYIVVETHGIGYQVHSAIRMRSAAS